MERNMIHRFTRAPSAAAAPALPQVRDPKMAVG
jgi:hypothetical protein